MKPLAAHSQSWGDTSVPANDQLQMYREVPWAETPPASTQRPSAVCAGGLKAGGSPKASSAKLSAHQLRAKYSVLSTLLLAWSVPLPAGTLLHAPDLPS